MRVNLGNHSIRTAQLKNRSISIHCWARPMKGPPYALWSVSFTAQHKVSLRDHVEKDAVYNQ